MAFARGKYAKAISDRSGMEFPYNEMVKEWNGMLVHKSEFEAKHPQLEPRAHGAEGHGLRNARPARTEEITQLRPAKNCGEYPRRVAPFSFSSAARVASPNLV